MSEARIIRCSNCGAPLDVAPYVPTARCSYCGRIVQVAPEPRPAPPVPTTPLSPFTPPQRSRLVYLVYLIPVLLIGASVMASVVVRGKASGAATNESRVTPEQLAALDLAGTREQITQRLDGKGFASRDGLHLQLHYRDIESVYLHWGGDSPGHVTGVNLSPVKGKTLPADITAAIAAELGPHFRNISGSQQHSHQEFQVGIYPHLAFSTRGRSAEELRRVEVMWRIVQRLVFGAKQVVSQQVKRDVLGTGYPLSSLVDAPPSLPLERMADLDALLPGAHGEPTERKIPLEHPVLESASYTWQNEPGGRVAYVHLYLYRGAEAAAPALAVCVSDVLGPGKEEVTDYAKGTRVRRWPSDSKPSARLSSDLLTVSFGRRHDAVSADLWQRLIKRLQSCR